MQENHVCNRPFSHTHILIKISYKYLNRKFLLKDDSKKVIAASFQLIFKSFIIY